MRNKKFNILNEWMGNSVNCIKMVLQKCKICLIVLLENVTYIDLEKDKHVEGDEKWNAQLLQTVQAIADMCHEIYI